jgi:DNA polymerase
MSTARVEWSGAEPAWRALAAEITSCVACTELAATRQQVVVGDLPVARSDVPAGLAPVARSDVRAGLAGLASVARSDGGAGLALVGEAPGAAEDAAGRPFVGKAGQLLDRTLAEVGLDRAQVAVLNVLKCRPPGNRPPKPDEVTRCRPYLERQLHLLAPRLVVALGLSAVAWFLGRRVTLAGSRGTVHEVEVAGQRLRVLATYHPSAAIRFGPNGAPMAALREDLAYAAKLLAEEPA